jgi:hypothetical protein
MNNNWVKRGVGDYGVEGLTIQVSGWWKKLQYVITLQVSILDNPEGLALRFYLPVKMYKERQYTIIKEREEV